MPQRFSRRLFLKTSLLASLALGCGQPVWASLAAPPASARLNLANPHTGEKLVVTYRDELGQYEPEALDAINHLCRCHYADRQHPIDVRTLDHLSLVTDLLGNNQEIHIISGYRSPEYQDFLRRRGKKIAPNSLHLQGRAIDIRMPGVKVASIRQAALQLRFGGVGYYPGRNMIHLDSGGFRTW
jgi:uncharacterized protein YcbK (DUF882 family)